MTSDRAAESRNAKKALKDAGYTGVSVTHGRGTSWGWMHAYVDRRGDTVDGWHREYERIIEIVARATGRTTSYERGRINVSQNRKEEVDA